MDKFDERLKGSRDEHKPTDGFVDRTMDEVRKHRIQHRRFSLKLWAPASVGIVAVLAIVVVFAPKPVRNDIIDSSKHTPAAQRAVQPSPSATTETINDGTDNASLQQDLSNIQSSMSQSGSEQTSADSAVNDNQQEISVPTN